MLLSDISESGRGAQRTGVYSDVSRQSQEARHFEETEKESLKVSVVRTF